ncbi:CaiB/BaiF CoA transferase family protein [Sphingobium ummariense]
MLKDLENEHKRVVATSCVNGIGPLSGVRVLDLGQIYQGPFATFLMAMAGADVIKIEPLSGESLRRRASVNLGATLPFEMLNGNKRSLTLDLKQEAGKALFRQLAAKVDVVLENFAPGVMDRLGIGYEALRAINPRLIYASGTGFGLRGPDRDKLAMDLTIQAASGVLACTGFPDSPPVKAGAAVADFTGGLSLYAGVLTALFDRGRTGEGRLVEIAMIETLYPTLASVLGMLYDKGEGSPERVGNRHGGLALVPYNVYRAADGYIAIFCPQEHHWRDLLRAMDREDLLDRPEFSDHVTRAAHMDEVDALVEAWSSQLTRAQILERTERFKFPCAPVRAVAEVIHDPHMHERGMLQTIQHPRLGEVVLPHSPLNYGGYERIDLVPAPELGGHSAEVLRDMLDMSNQDIAELKQSRVI